MSLPSPLYSTARMEHDGEWITLMPSRGPHFGQAWFDDAKKHGINDHRTRVRLIRWVPVIEEEAVTGGNCDCEGSRGAETQAVLSAPAEQSEGGPGTVSRVEQLLGSINGGETVYGTDTTHENIEWAENMEEPK